MDEASADLFGTLAASVGATSWLICVTRRDVETGFVGSGRRHPSRTRTPRRAPGHRVGRAGHPRRPAPGPRPARSWFGGPTAIPSSSGSCWPRRWAARRSTPSRTRWRRWWPPASTGCQQRRPPSPAAALGPRPVGPARPGAGGGRRAARTGRPHLAAAGRLRHLGRRRHRALPQPPAAGRRLRRAHLPAPTPTPQPGRRLHRGGHRPAARRAARAPVLPLPPRPALLRGLLLRARGGRVGQIGLRQLRGRRPLRAGPGGRTPDSPTSVRPIWPRSTRPWATPATAPAATPRRPSPTVQPGASSTTTPWPRPA